MKRVVIPALLVLGLAACTTPARYAPATSPRSAGFSELRVENDRYRVTFRGNGPPGQIEDYALLRAAELTIDQGYDWFQVVNRTAERTGSSGGPRISIGTGGYDYGRSSSVGVGVSTGFNLGGGTSFREVSLEIRMGRGETPRDRDTYNARDVAQSIGRRI